MERDVQDNVCIGYNNLRWLFSLSTVQTLSTLYGYAGYCLFCSWFMIQTGPPYLWLAVILAMRLLSWTGMQHRKLMQAHVHNCGCRYYGQCWLLLWSVSLPVVHHTIRPIIEAGHSRGHSAAIMDHCSIWLVQVRTISITVVDHRFGHRASVMDRYVHNCSLWWSALEDSAFFHEP